MSTHDKQDRFHRISPGNKQQKQTNSKSKKPWGEDLIFSLVILFKIFSFQQNYEIYKEIVKKA